MSETPPKKKLRQITLTDMVRPQPKSVSKDRHLTEAEAGEMSSKAKYTCSEKEQMSSKSAVREDDSQAGCSSSRERTPHKSPKKKHMMDKMKKKKKRKQLEYVESKSSASCGGANGSTSSKESWRGCPISSLQVLSDSSRHVPTVHLTPDHTVMVKLPVPDTGPPDPHPSSYSDVWDQHHVRMPCSPKSLYPICNDSESLAPRWSVICKALQRDMKSVKDLQRAILTYNSRYAEKWNFKGLHCLLEEEFEEEERSHFFEHTLPAIVNLALDLPNLVTQPPPMLTRYSTHSITLSQIQVASLIANAFFCTFPRRNAKGGDTEYASYPDINFNRLFSHREQRSLEKLKCLINYLRRVTKDRPDGLLTFTRQYVGMNDLPSWETSTHHLPELHIDSNGLIEEKEGLLQVDFANKFIGGGVLGLGCVQEEIRFVLSPELIVSRLFTQVLDKTEAIIVTGAEQFNEATGYASTFCWTGSHKDLTKRDSWKRRMCQVVAIDALRFTRPKIQYRPPLILRELNKVYAGYQPLKGSVGVPIGVATGNWGCGAFNGNPRLKALIQLATCGYTGRGVAYFTFGDEKLRDDLSTMHVFLKENNVTVGELVQALVQHGRREWADGTDLYQYIYHSLGGYDSDTDDEMGDFKSSPKKNEQKEGDSEEGHKRTVNSDESTFEPTNGGTQSNSNLSDNSTAVLDKSVVPAKDENLTEEKIVRVLMECDRLVEGRKKRSQETKEETRDNKFLVERNGDSSQGVENSSSEKSEKELEQHNCQSSKSLSEPVSLLACLDQIDQQSTFHK